MGNKKHTRVVIIGGYGNVGSILSKLIASELPADVVIAGRNARKAQSLANTIGEKASGVAVDVTKPSSYRKLFAPNSRVKVIISCIELPAHTKLPQEALEHGIHFTELSAEYAAHRRLFELDGIAKKNGSTAVVGVGLMPGLSNVLARSLIDQLEIADDVRINIMLGLGEAHGADSIKWTLAQLGSKYTVQYKDGAEVKTNFSGAHKTTLIGENRPRSFYHFNFSDQHVLNSGTKARRVTSHMAFDSRFVTKLLAAAEKIKLIALLKKVSPTLLHSIVASSAIGSSRYAVQVEASGVASGRHVQKTITASGNVEAIATASVAAYIAGLLYRDKVASGTVAIENVVNAPLLYAYLKAKNIQITGKDELATP